MRSAAAALFLVALGAGRARAEGFGLDVELLHSEAAFGGVPGLSQPWGLSPGRWTVASLVQLERDPMLIFDQGHEIGVLLDNRATFEPSVAYDTRRVRVGLAMPVAWQGDGDLPDYAAGGVGLGDPALTLGLPAWESRWAAVGLRGALRLPLGRQDAYLGEAAPRLAFGVSGRAGSSLVELLEDFGLQVRRRVVSPGHLRAWQELESATALRLNLLPDRVALLGTFLLRRGLGSQWDEPRNSGCEVLTGAQVRTRDLQLDLGAGRGACPGYGSTEFRAYLGATWLPPVRRRPAPEAPMIVDLDPGLVAVVEASEEPEELAWEPTQLARVHRDLIEIREPLQFRFDTAELLPVSRPTLQAVAAILLEHPEILRVSVAGHASEEGSFRYNYDLSNRRAEAAVRALVEAGIHPARLSARGMGEVVPVSLGEDEESLAKNRRVVFQILDRADPLDPIEAPARAVVPWTGAPLPEGDAE
ncbi:MAG: OmpA family protein [Pseudomonadota bacterium]